MFRLIWFNRSGKNIHLVTHPFKGTVAWEGVLVYSVPSCLNRTFLKAFWIWPIINRGMARFNSFSALGECTYFHFMPSPNALFFVARLLRQLLISFLAFSSALNFITRLLLHCLFSFAAFSYKAYWRNLNVMVWMFPFSFHLPNCVLPYLWSCPHPRSRAKFSGLAL